MHCFIDYRYTTLVLFYEFGGGHVHNLGFISYKFGDGQSCVNNMLIQYRRVSVASELKISVNDLMIIAT